MVSHWTAQGSWVLTYTHFWISVICMCKYYRNHCFWYNFLFNSIHWSWVFSSFRIQVNLDVWTRSIINRSISFYSYSTCFYWRDLDLHLLIRAICLQCWHEKWSLSKVSASYKENNPLKMPSKSLPFIFFIPFLLEFSSKSVFSMDRERWICFSPSPRSSARLARACRPFAAQPEVKPGVCECPDTEPHASLRLRTGGLFGWQLSLLPPSQFPVLVKDTWDIFKNGLFKIVTAVFS